jgi:hypothetical protein
VIKGKVRDQVVRENRTGTLDFYETIISDAGNTQAASELSVSQSSFAGFTTDVDFRTDLSGNPALHPTSAFRSFGTASSVRVDFGNKIINPGEAAEPFFIKTNARHFDLKGQTDVTAAAAGGLIVIGVTTAEPVIAPASISGTSFFDLNGDGVHQSGEPGLFGTTVFLDTNDDGKLEPGERSTLTDAFGHYSFGNLTPGTYHVEEVLRSGFRQTDPSVREYTVTVGEGQNLAGLDFGVRPVIFTERPVQETTAQALPTSNGQLFADSPNRILDEALSFVQPRT